MISTTVDIKDKGAEDVGKTNTVTSNIRCNNRSESTIQRAKIEPRSACILGLRIPTWTPKTSAVPQANVWSVYIASQHTNNSMLSQNNLASLAKAPTSK